MEIEAKLFSEAVRKHAHLRLRVRECRQSQNINQLVVFSKAKSLIRFEYDWLLQSVTSHHRPLILLHGA
jgi:hypothetical protein